MIDSLGGIGSYQSLFNTQQTDTTYKTVTSFDDVLQISGQNEAEKSEEEGALSAGLSAGGGSSSSTNSEMDLNNDGQVTMDEIIRYMEMQMQQAGNDFEQTASEEGSQQMSQNSGNITSLENFKTQQAFKAYQSSQMILSEVTDMITQSFFG